jgi:thymidylate kinase
MDTLIENSPDVNTIDQRRGLLVELVGVAGVGKSTITQALSSKKYSWLLVGTAPPVWKISTAYFYIKNIILLTPFLIRIIGNGGRFLKRQELAFMAILHGWHKIIRKDIEQMNKIMIIDQGPISIMAYLNVWGPDSLHKPNMQGWWEQIYNNWAQIIDMVVFLDAADEIIISRINNRSQKHHLKGQSIPIVVEWISRYRILYDQILSKIAANAHGMRVWRIDSGN